MRIEAHGGLDSLGRDITATKMNVNACRRTMISITLPFMARVEDNIAAIKRKLEGKRDKLHKLLKFVLHTTI